MSSNSKLSFFNRSGNSPTLQRKPNKTALRSASERGREYRKKKGDQGREQDRVRKQVDRADAKTPEGMRLLKEIVGKENIDENTRIAAAKKILATPELSTTRGSRFNNAPSGCGKLVYTCYVDTVGGRYCGEEQQIMGSEPSEEMVEATADDGDDEKEPEIEIAEEALEVGDDGDDGGENEEVVVEDIDEAGDACYFYINPNERGRRVTASGATGQGMPWKFPATDVGTLHNRKIGRVSAKASPTIAAISKTHSHRGTRLTIWPRHPVPSGLLLAVLSQGTR